MSKIFLFMMVTLDGYFEGPDHDLSWHNVDDEFNQFAAKQMSETGAILFGRRTYELMADFWPNYQAEDHENSVVREKMDTLPKVVFSKTLTEVKETADWQHVRLVHTVDADEIKKLKAETAKDIAVLGSSNLCVTLLENKLLDELRIMINPVVIGNGTPLFQGISKKLTYDLESSRTFHSGNVLLTLQPIVN